MQRTRLTSLIALSIFALARPAYAIDDEPAAASAGTATADAASGTQSAADEPQNVPDVSGNAAGGASSAELHTGETLADLAAAGYAGDAGKTDAAPVAAAPVDTSATTSAPDAGLVATPDAGEQGNAQGADSTQSFDASSSVVSAPTPILTTGAAGSAPDVTLTPTSSDAAVVTSESTTDTTSATNQISSQAVDVPNVAASPAASQPESDTASSATSASPVDVTPAAAPVDVAQSQADFAAATLPTALAEAPAVVAAAPVAIAPAEDVTNSTITPLDGAAAQPTVDEHEHPLHIAITRIEVYSENLGTEFMMQLKRLLSDVRDEARKVL